MDNSSHTVSARSVTISVEATKFHRGPLWTRRRIRKQSDLKPGDHIAWYRPWGYWHHAIYNGHPENDESKNSMSVFEFSYNKNIQKPIFHKTNAKFKCCLNLVYVINYAEDLDVRPSGC